MRKGRASLGWARHGKASLDLVRRGKVRLYKEADYEIIIAPKIKLV